MFPDRIECGTVFTDEDAETLFKDKIPFLAINNDVSLVSTMRALIAPRMSDATTLNISFDIVYDESIVGSWLCRNKNRRDAFMLIDAQTDDVFSDFKSNFIADAGDYEEAGAVEGFFAKAFPMHCFINQELRSTVVMVRNLDIRKLHYLQIALLAMMPWYKGSRESISDTEMALIQSLGKNDSSEYRRCLGELIKPYNLRDVKVRRLLTGFETSVDRQRKTIETEQIRRIDDSISAYERDIARLLQERNEHLLTLLGLESRIAETSGKDSELMEYILRNNKVSLRSVRENQLVFAVSDYISYYDEDMIERSLKYRRGALFEGAPSREAADSMAELMRSVLIDRRLRLRVSAVYRVTIGSEVEGLSHYGAEDIYADSMPNPHIHEYRCLGNYVSALNAALRTNDYIGIIEQCFASARSLNWGDPPVMNHFVRYMYDDRYRCIELPDGSVVYPSEAITWLYEEERRKAEEDRLRSLCFEEDNNDEEDNDDEEEE